MRRLGAGLAACWVMRGSSSPNGTYVAVFLVACWCVGGSVWARGRINVADAAILLASGLLMAIAFREGFMGSRTARRGEPLAEQE